MNKEGSSKYIDLMQSGRTKYKAKIRNLRIMLAGHAKNANSPFSKMPIDIIKYIGLMVLDRIQ
jgi:hypothetical protein